MNLKELYKNKQMVLSFEVFPPKGEGLEYTEKLNNLFDELTILSQFNPSLISVTYGAGGSSREKTFDLVMKIQKRFPVITMPHFTCVNFNKAQTLEYVKKVEASGINNILALRGDPPVGTEKFSVTEDGFAHANELVSFLKQNTDLSIAVAGYPEKHPEAINIEKDIENLKKKIDAGADVIYTQLYFDNDDFYKYCEKLKKSGINVPVIPGIMVLQSINQVDRIIKLSGSKIPRKLQDLLDSNKDNSIAIKQIGIDYATQQTYNLLSDNVQGLHFYPLNKSYAVSKVLKNLKIN